MPSSTDTRALRTTLHETFGYARLRAGQAEVISSVLAGRDTLAIMPTGAGKSLCYQLPALHLPGTTLVVSPLIALMKDQVEKLGECGVSAAAVNSTLGAREEQAVLAAIQRGRVDFVFTTPERLAYAPLVDALRRTPIDLFVIDEAHCISQWGHDFRPAYIEIADALERFGHAPLLALTATATAPVIRDISVQLRRPHFNIVNTGIYRANLRFRVVHVTSEEEKRERLLKFVRALEGNGIVYAATVKQVETVHAALLAAGIDAARYHGRLTARERDTAQEAFMSGERRVMVATNAFGLGIDKPDIRFVLHYQIPGSLETYYQESGRAGRDGEPAVCILLYDTRDRHVQQFFLGGRYPALEDLERAYASLRALAGQRPAVPFAELQAHAPHVAANKLRVALKLLKEGGYVEQNRNFHYRLAGRAAEEGALRRLAAEYGSRSAQDRERLERMVSYAQSAFCRWRVLLSYFEEAQDFERCGTCDICLYPMERRLAPARHERRSSVRVTEPSAARFQPGDRVCVPHYGEGRVLCASAEEAEIAFPDGRHRKFLASYVERL